MLFFSAFNQSITGIAILGSPISYRTIIMNEFYNINLSCAVAGDITACDLPDLIRCIAPRKIVLADLKNQILKSASFNL